MYHKDKIFNNFQLP